MVRYGFVRGDGPPPLLLAVVMVLLLLIGACSVPAPTPVEIGEETAPPYGCIEYRARGGEC